MTFGPWQLRLFSAGILEPGATRGHRVGALANLAAALLIASAALAAPKPAAVDDARLARASELPQNWLTHGGNWQEHRYSTLAQIHTGNVKQLKPA